MTGSRDGDARRIWVVTDGRAGNEVPARSLADALAAARAPAPTVVETKRIALRRAAAMLPAPVWPLLAARKAGVAGWPFSALADRGASLAQPWPDLVISAGRRSAPVVAEMRRRSDGRLKAVQILDPKMGPERFDLVIVPAHDRLSGPTVLSQPAALGRPPALERVDDPRLEALPRPLIGVLVGGPSRAAAMKPADIEALLGVLARAVDAGAGLAVLGSRRTPDWAQAMLAAGLPKASAFLWDGAEPNPYRALLAAADAFIVTADSVNMVSEAAATGRPVHVAPVARLADKLGRFHAAMAAGGHTRPLADFDPTGDPRAPGAWRPEPLDTLSQAVARAAPLLEADGVV